MKQHKTKSKQSAYSLRKHTSLLLPPSTSFRFLGALALGGLGFPVFPGHFCLHLHQHKLVTPLQALSPLGGIPARGKFLGQSLWKKMRPPRQTMRFSAGGLLNVYPCCAKAFYTECKARILKASPSDTNSIPILSKTRWNRKTMRYLSSWKGQELWIDFPLVSKRLFGELNKRSFRRMWELRTFTTTAAYFSTPFHLVFWKSRKPQEVETHHQWSHAWNQRLIWLRIFHVRCKSKYEGSPKRFPMCGGLLRPRTDPPVHNLFPRSFRPSIPTRTCAFQTKCKICTPSILNTCLRKEIHALETPRLLNIVNSSFCARRKKPVPLPGPPPWKLPEPLPRELYPGRLRLFNGPCKTPRAAGWRHFAFGWTPRTDGRSGFYGLGQRATLDAPRVSGVAAIAPVGPGATPRAAVLGAGWAGHWAAVPARLESPGDFWVSW